jgi:membrane-associated phospholipid phosphatase
MALKKVAISLFATTLLHQSITADSIKTSGDILAVLLPSLAYGATFYYDDNQGRDEFYKSIGSNLAIVTALKYSINRTRPNGEDYSFPSGHTALTFGSASFVDRRYGLGYATPLYLLAAYTGYTRVKSDKHYTSDVLAGALIGAVSSYYFTTSYKDFTIKPNIKKGIFGFTFNKHW